MLRLPSFASRFPASARLLVAAVLGALAFPLAAAGQSTQFNLHVLQNDREAGGDLVLKVELKQKRMSPRARWPGSRRTWTTTPTT
jgi:hypothetical protein